MGFLFYGHEVRQVECVIFKYKATRKNIRDTYITSGRVVDVASGSTCRYHVVKFHWLVALAA